MEGGWIHDSYVKAEGGGKLFVAGETMVALLMGLPDGDRNVHKMMQTRWWGKDSRLYMKELLAWSIKSDDDADETAIREVVAAYAKSIDFAEQNLKNMNNDCYLRYFNMGDKGAASYNIYRFLDSKTEKDLYNFRYQVFGYENLVVSLDKTTVMNKSQCETRTYNRR